MGANFEQVAKPYLDDKVDNLEHAQGAIDNLASLNLDIPDGDILNNLNSRIEDSLNYWNAPKGFDLETARAKNVKVYLGRQIDEGQLYRFQIPYVENEVFVAVEAIVAYLTSQINRAEVYPAQDEQMSRILASNLEKALQAHSEKFQLNVEVASAVRNLMLKRIGILYLWFDPDYGKAGEIRVKSVDPAHIVVDKNVERGQNPGFICHIHKDNLEELVYRFPEKRDDIFAQLGIKRGTPKQMSKTIAWRQVWVTHYVSGKPQEGCVSYFGKIVLAKYKNPNWIYTKGAEGNSKNFLDMPLKPYIPINYINDGTHYVDNTTLVEQASWIQEVLNKRGRQIMENADTANGFRVFDSKSIDMDDAQNLTGDPNQKMLVKTQGRPVSEMVMNIPAQMLPNYVVEDKTDLRNTVHSLMGTPSQFRGDDSDQTDTLGEAMMIKNQATGRQDLIVRAIDAAMDQYFKYLTQMMKVHYTEKHFFTLNGGDGDFDYVAMHRDNIEDGIQVSVKSGSSLPFDKARQQAVALQLAKMDRISTLDLYKDLGVDMPQKRYDNWMKEKTQPQDLAQTAEDELADTKAFEDYIEIMDGEAKVEPREDASKEHVLTHRKQMLTDKFLNAPAKKQRAFVAHVQEELKSLELRTTLDIMSQEEGMTGLDPTAPIQLPPPPPTPGMPPQGMPAAPAPQPTLGSVMTPTAPAAPGVVPPQQPTGLPTV